jgi:hypothetical protein
MEVNEIEVIIDKQGEVQVLVRGVKGPECLKVTQTLEAALGAEVISREYTPEIRESSVAQTTELSWMQEIEQNQPSGQHSVGGG